MQAESLITVIVPVYNVEAYLTRCIDSLLMQTYKNLEIILIDDGSSDSSGKICDYYSDLDSRIRVIHKINGGLSSARNAGLDIMTGQFVAFVDSDDYVSQNYIYNLFQALSKSNASVAMSSFKEVYGLNNEALKFCDLSNSPRMTVLSNIEALQRMFYQDGVETSAWGKLYSAKYFRDLRYPSNKLYEDIPVTYEILKSLDKAALIDSVDYFYFQRRESIQYQKFVHNKLDAIVHMNDVVQDIHGNYPDLVHAAHIRYFNTCFNIVMQIDDIDTHREDFEYVWGEIISLRKEILKNSSSSFKSRSAAIASYLGFRTAKHIYQRYTMRGKFIK